MKLAQVTFTIVVSDDLTDHQLEKLGEGAEDVFDGVEMFLRGRVADVIGPAAKLERKG